jgi:hypothetical protein
LTFVRCSIKDIFNSDDATCTTHKQTSVTSVREYM